MHDYQLRYLPLFHQELKEHALYIAQKLCNPQAADELVDATEQAILERLPQAEAFEPFHSRKDRKYPYYRIYVKNFIRQRYNMPAISTCITPVHVLL